MAANEMPGIAAGGLHNAVAGYELSNLISAPQDMQRHAVLDAAVRLRYSHLA
jgi:hypothetical protein